MLWINPSHKSHGASDKYPTMYHFATEICTHLCTFLWNMGPVHCGIYVTGVLHHIGPQHHYRSHLLIHYSFQIIIHTGWWPLFWLTNRSMPNQIADPGPKSGPARKSESRGPENGVSRWRRPNSDIYSQNHHFGLVYDKLAPHDDVIKWKHFSRYWPFVWEIHRSPVNSPQKGQWRGAWVFPMVWTNAGVKIETLAIWDAIALIMTLL